MAADGDGTQEREQGEHRAPPEGAGRGALQGEKNLSSFIIHESFMSVFFSHYLPFRLYRA